MGPLTYDVWTCVQRLLQSLPLQMTKWITEATHGMGRRHPKLRLSPRGGTLPEGGEPPLASRWKVMQVSGECSVRRWPSPPASGSAGSSVLSGADLGRCPVGVHV